MSTLTSPAVALTVDAFRVPDDGCLAYLVVDEVSRAALAIDSRLDEVDRFLDTLAVRDLRLAYALDTHTHTHAETVVPPGPITRIGEAKAQNALLRERDRDAFVSRLSVAAPPPADMAATPTSPPS